MLSGSVRLDVNGRGQHSNWLTTRPSHFGGAWGVGCTLCALLFRRIKSNDLAADLRGKKRLCTKWGRFDVRTITCLQRSAIDQHAHSNVHRLAVHAFTHPGEPIVHVIPPSLDASNEQLFAGRAPELEDWLRMHRGALTPTSFRGIEAQAKTGRHLQADSAKVTRFGIRQQFQIAAEVLRSRKRDWLREASSICLLWDDRGHLLSTRACSQTAHVCRAYISMPPPRFILARAAFF